MNKLLPLLCCLALALSSCVTHDQLLNFNQGPDFPAVAEAMGELPPLRIQSDDLLSIRVKALDEEAAEPYNLDGANMNMGNLGGGGGGGMRPLLGYLVDHQGYIDFPGLGALQVAGLTTNEVKEIIAEGLQPFLRDPVVVVRFLNFRITVLGEVRSPSTFFIANERVTILDAIGQAGDLTPYGNRTNLLIIREQEGERTYGRINLQSKDLFQSPYFFLRQNDIIYVEPLPEVTASVRDQSQRILPWISVITSLTTLAISLFALSR